MKLVDKIKNMFTEEVEEEKPVIKKEVMHVEINTPKQEEIEEEPKSDPRWEALKKLKDKN